MRRLLLALVALAGAHAALAAPLKLERVVLLMRHGIRPPTHEPPLDPALSSSAWPGWSTPPGYLTPRGADAIRLLAGYDRALWVGQGLLPAAGCPAAGQVLVYADVDERTVKTGQAYAAALAPGCGIATGHAGGPHDPLFSGDAGAVFDAKAAQAAMLQAAGGAPAALDAANAPLLRQMQDALAPGGAAFLDVPPAIKAKAPGRLPKLAGPVTEGASAAEDFLLEYLDDKPLAQVGWGRVDAADVEALLAFHPLAYTVTARPPYIADRTAAALAGRIAAALAGGPALTVLVGHDTNLAELGGLLDLHWSLGGYPADDPPPGGGIIFAVLRDTGTGDAYVTATYQVQTMDQMRNLTPLDQSHAPATQPLAIPGCGASAAPTACPLPSFLRLVAAKAVVAHAPAG